MYFNNGVFITLAKQKLMWSTHMSVEQNGQRGNYYHALSISIRSKETQGTEEPQFENHYCSEISSVSGFTFIMAKFI